jgi:thiol-disulfide isomerase/thioredoxin
MPRSVHTDDEAASAPPPAGRSPIWHLRWLVPLALALLAFLVFAMVQAMHYARAAQSMSTLQTAGFYTPSDKAPVPFSLPVLQPGASSTAQVGSTVTMSSLAGKPVVLNMWSSTCSVCKQETPAVESVARRVGGAVEFVGVDTLDQEGPALAFVQRYHVSYLELFDHSEKVGAGYAIPGLPVTIFVSAHDKVVGGYLGALTVKTLSHYLRSLFGVRVPS